MGNYRGVSSLDKQPQQLLNSLSHNTRLRVRKERERERGEREREREMEGEREREGEGEIEGEREGGREREREIGSVESFVLEPISVQDFLNPC